MTVIRCSLFYLTEMTTFEIVMASNMTIGFSIKNVWLWLLSDLRISMVPLSWHVMIIHKVIINWQFTHTGNHYILEYKSSQINCFILLFRDAQYFFQLHDQIGKFNGIGTSSLTNIGCFNIISIFFVIIRATFIF